AGCSGAAPRTSVYSRGVDVRSGSLTCLIFFAVGLAVYAPALGGEFIGDDIGYVVHNFYIHDLDLPGALALLDPFGPPARFTANYAPVGLAVHALEWRLFGEDPFGYHLLNLLLHTLASTLLVAVFLRYGIGRAAAGLLGAVFLLHPANVEAVAWIFQLKTVLALVLALAALLALSERPLAAWALFSLALLTKFQAIFALPVAAVFTLSHRTAGGGRRWLWLGAWSVLGLLCGLPEFVAFEAVGHAGMLGRYPTRWLQALDVAAIAGRYLVMATTSLGVSAYQEPAPVRSLLDPWALAGLLGLLLLGIRLALTLRARSLEAGYWTWAAAAYAPVSQVFPFLSPVGDRYLYFVLPGLLGGAYLWGRSVWERWAPGDSPAARRWSRPALGLGAALWAAFAVHSDARARIWRSELSTTLDAARHYPDGTSATNLAARRAR